MVFQKSLLQFKPRSWMSTIFVRLSNKLLQRKLQIIKCSSKQSRVTLPKNFNCQPSVHKWIKKRFSQHTTIFFWKQHESRFIHCFSYFLINIFQISLMQLPFQTEIKIPITNKDFFGTTFSFFFNYCKTFNFLPFLLPIIVYIFYH